MRTHSNTKPRCRPAALLLTISFVCATPNCQYISHSPLGYVVSPILGAHSLLLQGDPFPLPSSPNKSSATPDLAVQHSPRTADSRSPKIARPFLTTQSAYFPGIEWRRPRSYSPRAALDTSSSSTSQSKHLELVCADGSTELSRAKHDAPEMVSEQCEDRDNNALPV